MLSEQPLPPDSASGSEALNASAIGRDQPYCTGEILWWERMMLQQKAGTSEADIMPQIDGGERAFYDTAEAAQATALCLSGGGIRSAAFALGVVQALSAKKLLTSFDYLSTVSGGGYLGGFLQRWALGDARDGRNEVGLQETLAESLSGKNVIEIERLRDGATFITPQLGLFSSDSWTAVASSLRNIFVNWLLFAPLFMLLAALPVGFYWMLMAVSQYSVWAALLVHFISLTWAMAAVGHGMPTYRWECFMSPERISLNIVLPVIIACLSTLVIGSGPPILPLFGLDEEVWRMWPSALSAVLATLSGLTIAALLSVRSLKLTAVRIVADAPLWVCCAITAALIYLFVATSLLDREIVYLTEGGVAGLEFLIIGGPLLFVGAILAAGWLFSLFRSFVWHSTNVKADLDREWLVRLSAIMLKPVIAWAFLTFVTVFLVYYNFRTGDFATGIVASRLHFENGAGLIVGGFASGLVAALLGRSSATKWVGYARKFLSLEVIAVIATLAFVILALTMAGLLVDALAFQAHELIGAHFDEYVDPAWRMFWAHVAIIAALAIFVMIFGRVVDVNRFSLNGFYRNRLARAFLGAARAGRHLRGDTYDDERKADPFTGFDPADNVRLHSLWPAFRQERRRPALFPVINVALNAVATRRLAWQERKALPFILTPLACGSGWLRGGPGSPDGAYVMASRYGGLEKDQALDGCGVTLAAAMAISGAAASPNMGYHSSPATAFLMTLFNVRLGAWLPNPALWKRADRGNPVEQQRNAAGLLLRELSGKTDDISPDVYLSDGGHFENLGLYEMVRRRCAVIVAVDSGCDPDFKFEDLGNALRKIAIDLGVEIKFDNFAVGGKPLSKGRGVAHAIAAIHYPAGEDPKAAPGWVGRLIYLKPSLLKDLPLDVRAYAASHKQFPHETTADQWYAESQFESYRKLGQHLVEGLGRAGYERDLAGTEVKDGPARLFAFADDCSGNPPPASRPSAGGRKRAPHSSSNASE
jgi:hypothetical protein